MREKKQFEQGEDEETDKITYKGLNNIHFTEKKEKKKKKLFVILTFFSTKHFSIGRSNNGAFFSKPKMSSKFKP